MVQGENMSKLIANDIKNVGDFIEQTCTKYADKKAFSCFGETLTFAEVEKKTRAFACWLQQCTELEPGDRIVIQLPNISLYPIAAYGALRAGLILVNTNPLYTCQEMRHQFKDSGALAIVTLDSLLPKLKEVIKDTNINTVVTCQAQDLKSQNYLAPDNHTSLIQAINMGSELTLKERVNINLKNTCVLQYTGGTTGVSKGAELTHENLLSNAAQTMERIGSRCQESEEIFVCPLPLYHIYAFTVNMLTFFSHGNLNVLIPNPRDIEAFVTAIKPFKFTGFSGINTLFVGLCQSPEFKNLDFSSLKFTMSGGSALTSGALGVWKEVTGCSISEGYGLSETSPVLCINQPGKEVLGTVGKPLLATDIRIWDEKNRTVEHGHTGQVVAKGPQVMKGYWNMPEETKKAIVRGYFRTGDIGQVEDDGSIRIVDRLKDMIIVSGFNVYPNEIEDVLASHPCIIEAAVIGRDDDKTGECVCAFIVLNEGMSVDQVREHCRESLTAYKVPKQVTFLTELPKSTVGKVLRRELR